MNHETLLLFTTVKQDHKNYLLKRGSFISCIGVLLLLFAQSGILIFLLALSLIAYGLIPYRKASRLELNPESIQLTHEACVYKNYPIKLSDIQKIEWYETKKRYGIVATLHNKDRFLMPFFSKRSYERFESHLSTLSEREN
jgi:hypothetical protein